MGADLAAPKDQGHYFGLMQGFFNFGTTFTGMIVGPVAESEYMIPIFGETDGWRISFAAVSSAAFIGSVLSYLIMPEIPAAPLTEEEKQQGVCETIVTEIKAMLKFLKYPSFVLMICQGIFGSIPWIVLGNMNLYVRLSGWEQWTLFWLGLPGVFGVVGGFLGGLVSDTLTAKFGPRGRPATAMLTVAFGIPLQFMLWYGIPPGSALQTLWVFMVINALFNLLANWAQPGCNFPVLGQIVTGKDRNKVLCWEMAFENTMATIIGSNAVPILIRWLGSEDIEYNDEPDLDQARALGTAQAIIVCIPWMICFCVYSGLPWAFPYDLKRKEAEESRQHGARAGGFTVGPESRKAHGIIRGGSSAFWPNKGAGVASQSGKPQRHCAGLWVIPARFEAVSSEQQLISVARSSAENALPARAKSSLHSQARFVFLFS